MVFFMASFLHVWIQETGEVIRGDSGEITDFFSNQLRVAKVLHLEAS